MSKKMSNEKFKTSIGGQALIEGVMMRGPQKTAMSVRIPDGSIETETWETAPRKWYNKVPFLRGTFNFIGSMIVGYKCLMKSAEKAGFEDEINEEPSKLEKLLGDKLMTVVSIIASILGVLLAVVLFTVLPAFLIKNLSKVVELGGFRSVLEGAIRMLIFILYVYFVSKMSDIKRTFQYHGAEHKSISCYESGLELTPENARKSSRFHPRCGTSFILISIIVGIIISSFVTWDNVLLRTFIKLLLLPITVSISYELIQFAGKSNTALTRAISKPGMWMQRLTTYEPDDSQLEVAIAALKAVIPEDGVSDKIK